MIVTDRSAIAAQRLERTAMARTGHRKGSDAIMTGTVIGLSIALLSTGINALGGHSPFAFPNLASSAATVADVDTGPIAIAWGARADRALDIAPADDAHAFTELTAPPHRDAPTAMDDDARWIGSVHQPHL